MDKLDKISLSCQHDNTVYRVNKDVKSADIKSTYGELLAPSITSIIKALNIDGKKDVFYDLGSGTGRVCLQVYLETKAKCVGIEYFAKRHNKAVESAQKLRKTSKLVFKRGNFLKDDWSDATILYMCNTCFGQELTEKIIQKILQECKKLRAIVCVAPIESIYLHLVNTFNTPSSWSQSTNTYIYHLSAGR